MSLGSRLGYNNDLITIWELHPISQKDDLGRPKKVYIKTIVKGRWEYKTKTIRKNGTETTSTAMLIVPFNPYGKEILYELGGNASDSPGVNTFKSLSFEEVTRLRRATIEWIVYI